MHLEKEKGHQPVTIRISKLCPIAFYSFFAFFLLERKQNFQYYLNFVLTITNGCDNVPFSFQIFQNVNFLAILDTFQNKYVRDFDDFRRLLIFLSPLSYSGNNFSYLFPKPQLSKVSSCS